MEPKIKQIKIFKGGSLSKTQLIDHPIYEKCVLKEVSNSIEREYGFVRFSSQIKRHSYLSEKESSLFPKILEIGIDRKQEKAFCIYEYKENSISLYDYLTENKDLDKQILNEVVSNIYLAFDTLHSHKPVSPILNGSLNYYVEEEMIKPLNKYEKFLISDNTFFNGIKVYPPKEIISIISDKLKILEKIKSLKKGSLIHGNSTLENILINPNNLEISFIDVYDETYLDSPISDFSQILQCSKYGYGIKMRDNTNRIEKDLKNSTKFKLPKFTKSMLFFNQVFENKLKQRNFDMNLSLIISASQFTRLLPFRIKSNDILNTKYFYSLASWILSNG